MHFRPNCISNALGKLHFISSKTNVNRYLLESLSIERTIYFRINIKNRSTNMMLKWYLFNVNNFTTRWRQWDSSTSRQCQVYFASMEKKGGRDNSQEHLDIARIIVISSIFLCAIACLRQLFVGTVHLYDVCTFIFWNEVRTYGFCWWTVTENLTECLGMWDWQNLLVNYRNGHYQYIIYIMDN